MARKSGQQAAQSETAQRSDQQNQQETQQTGTPNDAQLQGAPESELKGDEQASAASPTTAPTGAPTAAPTAAPPAAAVAKDDPIKVRVLVNCHVGKCNSVATVKRSELPALMGQVDPSPAAVAYAEALDQ